MLKLSLITFIVSMNLALATQDHYQEIKNQIDDFENSVIQDFSFAIPADYSSNFDTDKQRELGGLLEEKFSLQKKVFYQAEEGLFNIERSLLPKVEKGKLTKEQADKLLTSVEYARRIIIHSRKNEVLARYHNLKKELNVNPSIKKLNDKIAKTKLPGKCKITSMIMDAVNGILSFNIESVSHDGKSKTTGFKISQQELDQGYFNARFDNGNHMGYRDKMILSFNKTNEDESISRFNLFENSNGELYHAEFIKEGATKPLLKILGFGIGSQSYDEKITCSVSGKSPASVPEKTVFNKEKLKEIYKKQNE